MFHVKQTTCQLVGRWFVGLGMGKKLCAGNAWLTLDGCGNQVAAVLWVVWAALHVAVQGNLFESGGLERSGQFRLQQWAKLGGVNLLLPGSIGAALQAEDVEVDQTIGEKVVKPQEQPFFIAVYLGLRLHPALLFLHYQVEIAVLKKN